MTSDYHHPGMLLPTPIKADITMLLNFENICWRDTRYLMEVWNFFECFMYRTVDTFEWFWKNLHLMKVGKSLCILDISLLYGKKATVLIQSMLNFNSFQNGRTTFSFVISTECQSLELWSAFKLLHAFGQISGSPHLALNGPNLGL